MHYQNRVHVSSDGELVLSSARLKEKAQTWGIGPQLGLKFNYQL